MITNLGTFLVIAGVLFLGLGIWGVLSEPY
jgi:hypothetical protein